jgi:hypothetical protein
MAACHAENTPAWLMSDSVAVYPPWSMWPYTRSEAALVYGRRPAQACMAALVYGGGAGVRPGRLVYGQVRTGTPAYTAKYSLARVPAPPPLQWTGVTGSAEPGPSAPWLLQDAARRRAVARPWLDVCCSARWAGGLFDCHGELKELLRPSIEGGVPPPRPACIMGDMKFTGNPCVTVVPLRVATSSP